MQSVTNGVVTYLDEKVGTTMVTTEKTLSVVQTTSSATPILSTTSSMNIHQILTRPLKRGLKGDAVTALQELLKKDPAIYPEGMVTGFYGPLTIAAVQRFQTKYNIVTSGDPESTGYGRVGPKTLAKLNEVYGETTTTPSTAATPQKPTLTERLSLGSKGEQVTILQTGLASDPSVYPEGQVTGYFGPLTTVAVQRFQIKYGLGDTATPGYGSVGPLTLAKFNEVFGR
jgi:peptidoglycan hydrolase-like protein with peptidoglycan-binding domain